MRKVLFFASLMLAAMSFTGCNNQPTNKETSKGINPFDPEAEVSYYGYAEISVPAGVTTVYMENYGGVDEQGNKKDLTVTPIQVNPVIAEPKNGKDVEPFGKVKLLFETPEKTLVSVYYKAIAEGSDFAPARGVRDAENQEEVDVYTLIDFPLDQIQGNGEMFGVTRYVRMPWDFAWENSAETGWVSTKTYPKDVVMYDEAHNHTLRYKFAYTGVAGAEGYFLDDAYIIEDHEVKGFKYTYSCGNYCPYCMPWGCSCGCGDVNPDFVPSGDLTGGVEPEIPSAPADVQVVKLTEPAKYVTVDENQTFYHSSGVVMFEDSWPTPVQGGVYDTDFNDVVVDYDFEAKTVADELLETQGWREQVKVVLHLRAVGSDIPYRVGVKLENFDLQYVDNIEQHFSLDSWQNPHGELPRVTENTLQHMSGHYENDPMNPVVEIAHIFVMTQSRAGQGADAEYTYTNGSVENHTVFNLTYGFKGGPDESQYDPSLPTDPNMSMSFSRIQNQKWYNAIPGYINVAGGLFTYTVIYNMKPRFDMTPEEREIAKKNMIDAVVNTTSQNFYIITKDFTPIGLKGYDPVLVHNESVSKYNTKFQSGVSAGNLEADIPYAGTNGNVWGFKCPTLTRHLWNKMYFSHAYPHYEEWVQSSGTQHKYWYYEDVNPKYLSCWW